MAWYAARRLLQMIPVFIGATLLIYAMVFLLPGDPITALGGERGLPPAVADQIRAQYHLDQPFLVQYWLWLKGLLTGDFGMSFSRRPVADLLAAAFPTTLKLAGMTLIIESVAGIGIGLWTGIRKGGFFDATFLIVSLILIAVPIFVIGFAGQVLFGIRLGWVPPTVGSNVSFETLILPAFVLATTSFAYILRLTRTTVAENRTADHVRTATAKGLSPSRLTGVHVLRNSLIPVVTFIGIDIGALLGGAVVTEGIFNIPGVGNLLYSAIRRHEAPTIVSVTTFLVIVYLVSNLIVDLLYSVLDPRIRYA
ncbi:ABC transporter permease [Xylanimonas sp. McL0601]|uniref:ABC transporter permease n=1 Tax=Xylanimonas sp. McL0601 TaxID=3414739 RepID=UPI003CED3749